MEILLGEWFRLPRLGSEIFVKLVKEAGLKYDKRHGFVVTAEADLNAVSAILSEAFGERIGFALKCYVCGGKAPCLTCIYRKNCNLEIVSPSCLSDDCMFDKDAYGKYVSKFKSDLYSHES